MPVKRTIATTVPAAGAAVTQDQVIDRAPYAGVISAVTIVPEAALTANATNFRTFRVMNKGQAGAGSTVAASFPTSTPTTDDLVAFKAKAIPLSGTPANLVVAAGDVLAVDETVAASGVAHSGYKVVVEISRG
jgi:hypothetical protein